MNGFEAIKLMEQGKEVIEVFHDFRDRYIFKIMDNNVCYRSENGSVYEVSESFDFSMEYEEYKPKPLTGWERVNVDERYHATGSKGLTFFTECNDGLDCKLFERANHFSTKEKAEEIDFKQTLFRKLQRFSDENGSSKIDWSDEIQRKYCIHYNTKDKVIEISTNSFLYEYGKVYFASKEIARKAIELFHDDLIKYFTGDFGGKA